MKRFSKVIFMLLILINIVFIFQNVSYAESISYTAGDALEWTGNQNVTNSTINITGAIVEVIRIVGTGISIIMLTYMAIKYMTAAPSEKAEFKKSAVAFIVGAIILFATSNILTIIYNFASKNVVY